MSQFEFQQESFAEPERIGGGDSFFALQSHAGDVDRKPTLLGKATCVQTSTHRPIEDDRSYPCQHRWPIRERSTSVDDQERNRKLIRLTHDDAVLLFCVYAACIVAGLIAVFFFINSYFNTESKDTASLLAAMSTGLIGSGVYYSRKLYTACINSHYTFVDTKQLSTSSEALQRVGSKSYFLLRPLFSIAFALVLCAVWRFGVSASGEGAQKLSTGFLYISIFLGFISGFLAGRVLTSLEGIGTQRIEAILAHTDGK